MTTTTKFKDRSDDLTTVLGQPYVESGYYAQDISEYFTPRCIMLYRDAIYDIVMVDGAFAKLRDGMETWQRGKIVDAAKEKLKHFHTPYNPVGALITLAPGAAWYEIETGESRFQMIVHGNDVWVAKRNSDSHYVNPLYRAKRLTKAQAYQEIINQGAA